MTSQQLTALLSPAGARVFAALAELPADPLVASSRLRAAGHDPNLVATALTQARLRERARTKFGTDAARMFFTSAGLEQASRAIVAGHRAAQLRALGVRRAIDVGCGIGGDLIALARAGIAVVGIEQDPATAEVARANVAALGIDSEIRELDATSVAPADLVAGFDAVFCDPARRAGGRRIFDPNSYLPSWSFVAEMLAACPLACVKVAPGIDHAAIQTLPGVTAPEWVSVAGALVEAALWHRMDVDAGQPRTEISANEHFAGVNARRHRATVLRPSQPPATLIGPGTAQAPIGEIGRYLYDPDDAVTRAHVIAELAEIIDGHLLDERIAYLTSDTATATPFARCYEIDEVLPFSVKRLRVALARRDVGVVELKKRGFAMTPEELRPQLRLRGSGSSTVVLTRIGTNPTAILCRPI